MPIEPSSSTATAPPTPGALSPDPLTRWRRREIGAVAGLSVLLFACYTAYSISRYATYLTAGYDLGIFDQAVRDYAHLKAPIVPLKGAGYDVLGDHFHPIIAVVAPLYWIWNSPCMLLIVQAALVAGTVPIVYRFTRRRAEPAVAFVVCAAFGVGWAIQAMLDFDFHEIAFALPLLAWGIDALDRRADRQLLLSCALLLLVREDMGALVLVLGLIRLAPTLRRDTGSRWPGIVLVLAGAAGYVLATSVIIPAFARDSQFTYWQYDELGPNLPAALGHLLTHPWDAVRYLVSPTIKAQSLAYLLVPLAVLLPLRSRYAWIALPLLAERFYATRELLWTTHYHYSALPWLVLLLAMADGGARLGVFSHPITRRALLAWLLIVPVWLTAFDHTVPADARRMIDGDAWRITAHTRAQQAVVGKLPDDVCVAVDDHLAPHLARRDYVTLADAQPGTADFVALDLSFPTIGGNSGPTPEAVLAAVQADGYRVTFQQDTLILLESPTYQGPSAACRPLGPGKW